MKNIDISLVGRDIALKFWEGSPHASIFTHPDILAGLAAHVEWWLCRRGQYAICLWPVCLDENGRSIIPDFSYYVGPMWSTHGLATSHHRSLAMSTAVYQGFIDRLLKTYGEIRADLPLGVTDVRLFDWWNYHEPAKSRFSIRPCYTARITALQSKAMEQIVSEFRKARRREVKRVERNGAPMKEGQWCSDEIITLYKGVMARQKEAVGLSAEQSIRHLLNMARQGFGDVGAYRDPQSGDLVCADLQLYGNGAANGVLAVVDDRWRNRGLNAWMTKESIAKAQLKGCDVFDFNGANSPHRGDDKHSFGASAQLYFQIELAGTEQ